MSTNIILWGLLKRHEANFEHPYLKFDTLSSVSVFFNTTTIIISIKITLKGKKPRIVTNAIFAIISVSFYDTSWYRYHPNLKIKEIVKFKQKINERIFSTNNKLYSRMQCNWSIYIHCFITNDKKSRNLKNN